MYSSARKVNKMDEKQKQRDKLKQEVMFTVPGLPKGKARPRFAKIGNFVKTYTPKETVSYENLIKLCYMSGAGKFQFNYLEQGQPCDVDVIAWFPYPKSMTKKELSSKPEYTKKPDCDNIGKIVCDALNGVAWNDDSQVVTLTVQKRYTDQEPSLCVSIYSNKDDKLT